MAASRPHITVSHHDQYGVVAAVSHNNHASYHTLRLVGFERLPGSNLYALSEPNHDPTRRGQQAVQSLRAAQYSVESDAAYDLRPQIRITAGRRLLDRLENRPAPEVSSVEQVALASARAFDASSDIRGNGRADRTSSAQQGRAQAATAVSPARAGVYAPLQPAAEVAYRPTSHSQPPVLAR
ncbi:hypothetical protein ACIGT4_27335 [Streptomyces sioyaensis]|uniref:hypothetical protein n=1 Tax=Streptomyces sioyaensis TaxID=67364 RepID=UPI0037D95F60